jgi:succinoglycan biosynthesis transport protein ExoP
MNSPPRSPFPEPPPSSGAQLREIIRVLALRGWIVLLFVLAVGGAALAWALIQTDKYRATAVLVYDPGNAGRALTGSEDFPVLSAAPAEPATALKTITSLVRTAPVRRRAEQDAGPISEEVTASSTPDTNIIELTAEAGSAERAALVANVWSDALARARSDANQAGLREGISLIERELATTRDPRARKRLERQLQTLRVSAALQQSDVRVAERASEPTSSFSPKLPRDVAIGAIAGALLGLLFVAGAELLDRRIKSPADAEETWEAPVLAQIPPSAPEATSNGAPDRAAMEAFRYLQANLAFLAAAKEVRVIAVTSPLQEEGKTTVARGLAESLAAAGLDVALLDCDFRHPQLTEALDVGESGLSNLLAGSASLQDLVREVPLDGYQARANGSARLFRVIGAGPSPPNPYELFSSEAMRETLRTLASQHDYVILDCAPLLPVSDSVPIIAAVDGVIVAQRLNLSKADAAYRAREVIERTNGRLLGLALAVPRRLYEKSGGYGYGYPGRLIRLQR